MSSYVNPGNVPLSMAVYLATDNYDYEPDTISATGLIRPLRQIVLAKRVPEGARQVDINTLVKSRMGNSIHDGIEQSWINNAPRALKQLGYPESVIARIKVNPDPDELEEGDIPVYLEKRSYRNVGNVVVSGKFDFVAEGQVEDFKTTGTFSWSNERAGSQKEEQYRLQGSIYRWLNPKIITSDFIAINFLFTDWAKGFVGTKPQYPDQPVKRKFVQLKSVNETDAWVRRKIELIDRYMDADQDDIPRCTDDELWRQAPVYKYYKNPNNRKRSTKNFTNAAEAYQRLAEDGGVGVVIEQPGTVKACAFCPAFDVCTQKDELIASGDLQL